MNTLKYILFALYIFNGIIASGQATQPNRFEKKTRNSDEYFTLISLRENGIALIRDKEKYSQGNSTWEIIILDNELNEKATQELIIKDRSRLIGYEVTTDRLYFLFRTSDSNKADLELSEIDFNGVEVGRFTLSPALDLQITHFSIVNKNAIIGGKVNNEPAVLLFDQSTKTMKVIPGFFQVDTELMDLKVNHNGTFNSVLIDRHNRFDRKIVFRTFSHLGEPLLEDVIPLNETHYPMKGVASALIREDLALLGTWGERNAKLPNGFFFVSVDPFQTQKINYLPFGKMEHYTDYLSVKRAAKIQEEANKSELNDKIPSFVNSVSVQRIDETEAGFILHYESHSGQPSTLNNNQYSMYNPYSPFGMNGMYFPRMSRFYQPYQGYYPQNTQEINYHQTGVAAFNQSGKLIWDYSFKFDEIKMPSVEQVSDFLYFNNQVFLAYKKEITFLLRRVDTRTGAFVDMVENIKPKLPNDVIRNDKEYEGGVRFWYENHFYVYGYQTVRNETIEDRSRVVFYINKISVQ